MVRSGLRSLVASRFATRFWGRLSTPAVSIFTLHRFQVRDCAVEGHDPEVLSAILGELRRERIDILPLETIVRSVQEQSQLPRRGVVFTVDDGYFDFAEVGAPVFAAFDCPVTVFLTTGFVDGTDWMWWDKVGHILRHGNVSALGLGHSLPLSTQTEGVDSPASVEAIIEALKGVPTSELEAILQWLAEMAEVELPPGAPRSVRPMSWDDIRALAAKGVSFGPHTVTHPILTGAALPRAKDEISLGWERLAVMVPNALPVLAYPNGAFTPREIAIAQQAGMVAAVTTVPGYIPLPVPDLPPDLLLRLPRFSFDDRPAATMLTASGFHALRHPRLLQEWRRAPLT